MKRYRVCFLLWIVFWFGIWIFGNSNMGIYILAASCISVAAEGVLAFFAKRHLTVTLSTDTVAAKNTETVVKVMVQNSGFVSCSKIGIRVLYRNMLTGEESSEMAYTSVNGRLAAVADLVYQSGYCGKISVETAGFAVYDALGLFCFKGNMDSKTAILVLPELYPVELSVSPQRQMDMNSDEYSMLRWGDDPSETFALREYQPGDKIKNIHWKLSEKLGETMVRELGLPVNNSLLLLFDNSVILDMPDKAALELLGETAVSVSTALMSGQISHDIAWLDHERKELVFCHVTGEEDMTMVMSGILSAGIKQTSQTVLDQLSEEHDLTAYAHILVITANSGGDTENIGDTSIVRLSPVLEDKEGLYVEV